MVDISFETAAQTDARLRQVIRAATLTTYPDPYTFVETALGGTPPTVDDHTLALVRDDEVWSQLVPHRDGLGQAFAIFRFHFPVSVDNSGFVGWLATHLKARFGTGVLVVCGQNSGCGGVFDYWGCPAELGDAVIGEMRSLVG